MACGQGWEFDLWFFVLITHFLTSKSKRANSQPCLWSKHQLVTKGGVILHSFAIVDIRHVVAYFLGVKFQKLPSYRPSVCGPCIAKF